MLRCREPTEILHLSIKFSKVHSECQTTITEISYAKALKKDGKAAQLLGPVHDTGYWNIGKNYLIAVGKNVCLGDQRLIFCADGTMVRKIFTTYPVVEFNPQSCCSIVVSSSDVTRTVRPFL